MNVMALLAIAALVHAKDFGYNPTNATAALQQAIDSGAATVVVDAMPSPWYVDPLKLRSRQTIRLAKGAKIHAFLPNWEKFKKHSLFCIQEGLTDITLEGEDMKECLIGSFESTAQRKRYCKPGMELQTGVYIGKGATNIVVRKLSLAHCGCDGMGVGGWRIPSHNVLVEDVDMFDNHRQACSPMVADGLVFRRCRFRDTDGTEPGAGADMEPCYDVHPVKGVIFEDCEFGNNNGGGLITPLSSIFPIDVTVRRCTFHGEKGRSPISILARGDTYRNRKTTADVVFNFEDCLIESYWNDPAINIATAPIFTLHFKNCRIKEVPGWSCWRGGRVCSAIEFYLDRDYKGAFPPEKCGKITFENFKIEGFKGRPAIEFVDILGKQDVVGCMSGIIDFNGEKIDTSKINYKAMDVDEPLPKRLGVNSFAPNHQALSTKHQALSTNLRLVPWGDWYEPRPCYNFYYWAEKGTKSIFSIAYPFKTDITDFTKALKGVHQTLETPTGAVDLGELKPGTNRFEVVAETTGWHSFFPPKQGGEGNNVRVLIDPSTPLAYQADSVETGDLKFELRDKTKDYTGYFEVPPKVECRVRVSGGTVEIFDEKGRSVGKAVEGKYPGRKIITFTSASDRSEVYSFKTPAAGGMRRMRFYAPLNSIIADSPDLLPRRNETGVRRVFREARLTRGNTNIMVVQPIDRASWIWSADDAAEGAGASGISHDGQRGTDVSNVFVFRKKFEVKPGDGPLVIDVSADERFYLTCDGTFVARGPNRAQVENWQYQTYSLDLAPGSHELRAVVTRLGEHAPLAQLSYRGGFILKADGPYDSRLTTGKADWEIGRFSGMHPNGIDNGVWGTGSQFVIAGSGPFAVEPAKWTKPVVVRGPASRNETHASYGGRTPGWMLFPSQLPDQTESAVRPGVFCAAAHGTAWRTNHVYVADETKTPEVAAFNRLLKGEVKEVVIPAKTRLQLAWHLGRYICAYPEAVLSKGRGARLSWTFTESSRDGSSKRKGDRTAIVGKFLEGYGDTYRADGRENAVFSAPWFRCGLWSRIDIETADEPLVVRDLRLVESRYPVEMESVFETSDDPSLADIRRICARAMQMCCHEMLFDCPYYEQQMYPGDTRVQLLVLSALSRDDRIIRRAMEIYDLGTRDDGQCPFNWPTRGTQEGFTYTLCYLAMYGDYAMNHADRAWLRARLPGLRKSMAGCELYENADGLVEETPGWNFMDWTTEWGSSWVPNSREGRNANSFVNLFWLLAMQSAATTERALGNELQAQYWETKAKRLKAAIVAAFWDAGRGLVADTKEKKTFSEHSQALAILTDCLPADKRDICFRHLVGDKDLARTTVYFNYYLFEAYFKMGRPDLFLKRLDLWRGYVAKGITTLTESPDSDKHEARSDCHAWGAHPIWFMQTGLAGIRSSAPFFESVRVAPQPGSLKSLKARHPHPKGWIDVDLTFAGGRVSGTVVTPVAGTFAFGGREIPLKPGENRIGL